MANRFFFQLTSFHMFMTDLDLDLAVIVRNCHCEVFQVYVLCFKVFQYTYNRLTAGVKCNFKIVGTIKNTGPL